MKVIFSGLESSGKSLKLAMVAEDLVYRNAKWKEKTGIVRPIASNLKFSKEFEKMAEEKGIPINYWEHLHELEKIQQSDVIIDEVGNYFDSRMWSDLSLDIRRWLTQGAKCGIELYGSAQDFAQIDKAFRRLTNELYLITKVMGSRRPSNTKPPVKYIWGICLMKELDPMGYDEDKSKFNSASWLPKIFTIRRKACEIFDTTQKIQRSKPYPYKHIERDCEIPFCPHLTHNRKILHI